VILELTANAALDITSAEMLEQLTTTLRTAGVDLALADLRQPVIEMARRTGLLKTLGEDRIFRTLGDAIEVLSRPAEREPALQSAPTSVSERRSND
jgi:MFS superfamily sulfate permease-like transporter